MNKKLLFLFCLNYSFLFSQNTNNQSVKAISDSTNLILEEVAITASRSEKPMLNTAEAIASYSFELLQKKQIRTTPEALQSATGVFVQKTNHGGGSPIIRGLTGNQTLFLIDGIRLNNATFRYGPNQYFNTIDAFSLEKIEVLRGGGAVQYGSDAMGGTIQVFTTTPSFSTTNEWNGTILTKFLSQKMEQTGRAVLGFSSKKIAFSTGVTTRNFGDLMGGKKTKTQSPTGYKELDFDLKMRLKLSEKNMLTVAHQNVTQYDVPIYHKITLENFAKNHTEKQARQLTYARFDGDFQSNFFQKYYLIASFQQTNEIRLQQKNNSHILRKEQDKVKTFGFNFNINHCLSNTYKINSGVEYYHDFVNSNRKDSDLLLKTTSEKRGLYPDASKMQHFSIYSSQVFDFQKNSLQTGVRWNTYHIHVNDENQQSVKISPSAWVGNVSFLRKIKKETSIFLSANAAFRTPNIDDLGTLGVVDFRYETPNYQLSSEKSYNFQVGFKHHSSRFRLETYLFRNELRDLIARVKIENQTVAGVQVYQKLNIEKAFIQGIESDFLYQLNQRFSISSNLTYTFGQSISQQEPLRRIPPFSGSIKLQYTHNQFFTHIEYIATDTQKRLSAADKSDNRINPNGTPSWQIINIATGFTYKKINISLSAFNLFNVDYRVHGSGVNGMGRALGATLDYTF
jgi:hemoglobin/transferrin/lactoferrin receptor protein